MLSEVQLFAIGLVASVIVWLLKAFKVTSGAGVLTAGVYVVALVLAFVFAPVALPVAPVCSELVTCVPAGLNWAAALLAALSPFVGFATLVYNVLLKQVLDKYAAPLLPKRSG